MPALHTLAARALAPLLPRASGAAARALHRFSLAERGSELTLRWAAQRIADADLRAAVLRHALDESRHARAFHKRAAELWQEGSPPPVDADAEDLHASLGEDGFFAFLALAEARGRDEFEGYRRSFAARGDERTAALLSAIIADEAQHESYSRAELVRRLGEAGARRRLRAVALWEAWRAFRRAGRAIADAVFSALMALLYVTLLPPLWLLLRLTRPARRGLCPPAP